MSTQSSNTAQRVIHVQRPSLSSGANIPEYVNGGQEYSVRVTTTPHGTIYEKHFQESANPSGDSLRSYIDKLTDFTEFLTDATVDLETISDYGYDRADVYVEGWSSEITQEEIEYALNVEREALLALEAQEAKERKEAIKQIKLIKKKFPDLIN